MRSRVVKRAVICLILAAASAPAYASNRDAPVGEFRRLNAKAVHPRSYHAWIGDVYQVFLRYQVLPDEIVENLRVRVEGRAMGVVGVADTRPGVPGCGEISVLLSARNVGFASVDITPIIGGSAVGASYRLNFWVEGARPKGGYAGSADEVFRIKVSQAGGSQFVFFDPNMRSVDLPVKITFFNGGQMPLRFEPEEYLFAFLDGQGEQLDGALMVAPLHRVIVVPPNQPVDDKPVLRVSTSPLEDGKEYYFLATIRGRAGIVKLHAKATSTSGK